MSETAAAEKRNLSEAALARLRQLQQKEITESAVYAELAKRAKGEENQKILMRLSKDERRHYETWRGYTGEDMHPEAGKVLWYKFLSRIFGYTFVSVIMEQGEGRAQLAYDALADEVPESVQICNEEKIHEQALLKITKEESLSYIGSIMLGLNDALMELVALLAGLTFSMQDTRLAGLAGLIVTLCATLSVGATEFLAARSQGHGSGIKAALYTGLAYLFTGLLLLLPYFLFPSSAYVWAFVCMAVIAVLIIAVFNFYVSVVNNFNFKKRFLQMLLISTVVGALAYLIAETAGHMLGIHL